MSYKLSRNKVNRLASLITEHVERSEDLDYLDDIGNVRYRAFQLIMDELRLFEQIENRVRDRMRTQKRNVPEGSREWEILFRKYSTEELTNLARYWD